MARISKSFLEGTTWLRYLAVCLSFTVTGCGSINGLASKKAHHGQLASSALIVSVSFGPDGKLWRVRPVTSSVVLDYSEDFGKTFSAPVAVNTSLKLVQASPEDRPSIVVDNKGKIIVVFKADNVVPWSIYVSVSNDGGRHFSVPVLVSEKAGQFMHYQDVIAVNNDGQPYVFWSDERRRKAEKGNALYYAPVEMTDSIRTPNFLLKKSICECCRLAVDFDLDNNPVVLARTLYNNGIRDHGLLIRRSDNSWTERRVTFDNWNIAGCPEHGPALSIGPDGRYHITWFTQGDERQGLFYAHSNSQGAKLSTPRRVGDRLQLPGHADVLSIGNRVALVWREFDGEKTIVKTRLSVDRGETWSSDRVIANSAYTADYPFLVSHGEKIFVSWNSENSDYRLIPLNFEE